MDPLTALSLAGTVVQFVDFGSKLISASKELYAKTELDVHGQAALAANDILNYTIKLRRTLNEPGTATLTEDDLALESICKGCDDLAHDLLERLNNLKVPPPKANKKELTRVWPTLSAAFQSIWTKQELLDIQTRLKDYRDQIDSRIIRSLIPRIDMKFLEQSKRFDNLDAANKEIVKALANHSASNNPGLQSQIRGLSLLLDRAEAVVISQKDANKRIIVDIFQESSVHSYDEESNSQVAKIRSADNRIREGVTNELIDSLRFTEITERFETVDESHAKTFDWIFQPIQSTAQYEQGRRWSDFRSWLQYGAGLYWINGKAGSGKSTLMKHIVSHGKTSVLLKSWAGDSNLCIGEFFFWNSGSMQQRSQSGLFRSLLYKILSQSPELVPIVLPAQWSAGYTAKCQSQYFRPVPWALSTLKLAFKTLISQTAVPLKLCLFIDGLDEYEGNDAEIAELFGNASMSENVKICCSSRPHHAFEEVFATQPGLRLQDLTYLDMRQYVHDRLEMNGRMQELNRNEPEATKQLIEEIGNAASGVFLWVKLVVSSLLSGLGNRDGISYLQMRLRQLPPELDDLYDHMVFKIDKVYQRDRARLFQLIGTAFQNQDNDLFSWPATSRLSILFLSFASEEDETLALKAEPGFMVKEKIINRCQDMEVRLKTRCGGLLEVNYGNQDPSTRTVSPDMTISYLHRTVRDYLELWETRQRLVDVSDGQQKNSFSASHAIFKAHILMLKALDATNIIERPPWQLIEDSLTWARRHERDTQASDPELVDEFYNVAHKQWNDTRYNQRPFFKQHESMLTLATQCGLYHYLEAKLSQQNIIGTLGLPRSLLDYALRPDKETETFVSVGVVSTLLKYGAKPNRLETHSSTSPWQNALGYLNVVVSGMHAGPKRLYIWNLWRPILKVLLDFDANPNAICVEPDKFINIRYKRVRSNKGWSADEVFARAFADDRARIDECLTILEDSRRRFRRSKTRDAAEKKSETCCTVQ